jgi:hypothetical protein
MNPQTPQQPQFRTETFEGKTYQFPADATDDEIVQYFTKNDPKAQKPTANPASDKLTQFYNPDGTVKADAQRPNNNLTTFGQVLMPLLQVANPKNWWEAGKQVYQVGKDTLTGDASPESQARLQHLISPTGNEMGQRAAEAMNIAVGKGPSNTPWQARLLGAPAAAIYGLASLPGVNALATPFVHSAQGLGHGMATGNTQEIAQSAGEGLAAFASAQAGRMAPRLGQAANQQLNRLALRPTNTLSQQFPEMAAVTAEEGINPRVGPITRRSEAVNQQAKTLAANTPGQVDIDRLIRDTSDYVANKTGATAITSKGPEFWQDINTLEQEARTNYAQQTNGRAFLLPDEALSSKVAAGRQGRFNADPNAAAKTPAQKLWSEGEALALKQQLVELNPEFEKILRTQKGLMGAREAATDVAHESVVSQARLAALLAAGAGEAAHIPLSWQAGAAIEGLTNPWTNSALQTAIRTSSRIASSPVSRSLGAGVVAPNMSENLKRKIQDALKAGRTPR